MFIRKGLVLLTILATAKGELIFKSESYGSTGCPSGLPISNGDCQQSGDSVDDGSGVIYRTAQVVLRSQMQEALESPGTITAIAGSQAISVAEGNRYIKLSAVLSEGATSCTIALSGTLADKVAQIGTASVTANSCDFYLANNKYLGDVVVTVTYDDDDATKVELPLRFSSHANDPSIEAAKDLGYTSSSLQVVEQNENMHNLAWAAVSATTNSLIIQVDGLFVDKRYKVKDQAGVDLLPQSVGGSPVDGFIVDTEGIDFKAEILEYLGIGTAIKVNSPTSAIVSFDKKTHASYSSGAASDTGQALSNGLPQLQGNGATLNIEYAQYVLDHQHAFSYTGLPTFQRAYVDDCEVCDFRVSLKGLDDGSSNNIYLVNTAVTLVVSILPQDTSAFQVNTLQLTAKSAEFMLEQGSRHPLSDLFDIAESGHTNSKSSLLGAANTEDLRADIKYDDVEIACKKIDGSAADDNLEDVPIAKYTPSLLLPYLQACHVQVQSNSFGAKKDIVYDNSQDAASTVGLKETDGRKVRIGSHELSLNDEVDLTAKSDIGPIGDTLPLSISKALVTGALTFDVEEITGGSLAKVDVSTAVAVTTSATDGSGVAFNVISKDTCDGSLKLRFKYNSDATSYYDVRLPCSRISKSGASDLLSLKYSYNTVLNLATDALEIDAYYTSETAYAREAKFGTCQNDNNITAKGGACTAPFVEDDANTPNGELEFVKTSGGLEALKQCSTTVSRESDTYVMTYTLATKYTRATAGENEGFTSTISYCDDQTFTLTINRDATASVVATGVTPSANLRAVLVKDVAWSAKNGAGCLDDKYRLQVLLESKDQNSQGVYAISDLTAAFLDISSGALNPNDMVIHDVGGETTIPGTPLISADPTASNGNHFIVRGKCIAIDSCSGTGNGGGDSWADYSEQFDTDMVIRGNVLLSSPPISFDTEVRMTLNFQECPIDGEGTSNGVVRIALHLAVDGTCDTEVASAAVRNPLIQDCLQAESSNTAVVESHAYVTPLATTALSQAANTLAGTQGWSVDSSEIYLEQELANGNPVGTARKMCDDNTAATVTIGSGNAHSVVPVCSSHNVNFPLSSLQYYATDTFKVRYEVTLKSSVLDARRHLRATHILQSASASASAESNGLQVHSAIAESNAEAPAESNAEAPAEEAPAAAAPAAPAAPVSEAAETSGVNKQSIDESWWFGLSALILVVVGILLRLLYCAFPALANQGSRGSGVLSAQPGALGYQPVRQDRYANLRY